MRQIQLLVFIFILLIVYNCNKRVMKFNPEKEKKLSIENNEKFILSFECSPSTGYSWVLDYNSDSTIVEFLEKNMEKKQKELNLLGGKATEKWEFKANKSGKANLIFYYQRSWEDKTPIDSTLYKIKVK